MSGESEKNDELAALNERLKQMRSRARESVGKRENAEPHPVLTMMWLAFNILSELLGGVACGLAIGWGLDKWLGTRPVFIAVFLIVGCIAAVLNVVRLLRREEDKRKNDENRHSRCGCDHHRRLPGRLPRQER